MECSVRRSYPRNMRKDEKLAVPTFLRQWRDYRDMTQERLAALVEMSPPSISQLETGKQGFTDKSLAAFAKALGCSPADLLAFDPTKPDGLWPLFCAADKLSGPERTRVYNTMKALLDPI